MKDLVFHYKLSSQGENSENSSIKKKGSLVSTLFRAVYGAYKGVYSPLGVMCGGILISHFNWEYLTLIKCGGCLKWVHNISGKLENNG